MIKLAPRFINTIFLAITFLVFTNFSVYSETAPENIGIITLHPKWGMPAHIQDHWERIGKLRVFKKKFQRKCGKGIWVCSDDKTIVSHGRNELGLLTIDLYEEGYLVESPICAWSKIKKYSLPVDEALQDCISPRIDRLKNKGAKKIVVLGKSLGANMAIRAGVVIDGIDAIIAMAPGHRPEKPFIMKKHSADVEHARGKVKNGKGEEFFNYMDNNQGKEKSLEVRAANFLSWFDPNGKAVMGTNAPKIKNGIPFLWIAGSDDYISDGTGKSIYDSVPKNSQSKFLLVDGGHGDVRENGKEKIIEWLKGL